MNFDRDRSGTVESHEFQQALTSFGYRLHPNTINILVHRFSDGGRIGFDDFVSCCVKLRALTGLVFLSIISRDVIKNEMACNFCTILACFSVGCICLCVFVCE